ncbi:MAG: transglutaminase family protein [Sphingobacteriia bacterium]|nr:MAG: transglutaminase family protein [Sphingobacteriia bacterium]TAG29557.1 MAG: transglutaminase family protein [Sphingobacteriia bacterium]TAH07230.1 MAG: transglutaminase family protein [Sphingobacteriia bacterium]
MAVFKIHHITKYEYNQPVKESVNEIKIYPANSATQQVLEHHLQITGNPEVLLFTDYWGNKVGNFNLLRPHKELLIESKLLIQTAAEDLPSLPVIPIREAVFDPLDLQLLVYVQSGKIIAQSFIDAVIEKIYDPKKSIVDIAFECSGYVFENFSYIKGITTIETTVDEIIEHQSGVCQDFAHLLLVLLRTMRIPARYVSGYICPNKNGMRGEGATHAWVEFYIPEYGWVGIDPTNNVWVSGHHVKLSVGRGFIDCTPAKGTFKGPAQQFLSVYVSVGYEDGVVFEENNAVMLEKTSEKLSQQIIDNFAAQQQ